jgi:hypothetical protein
MKFYVIIFSLFFAAAQNAVAKDLNDADKAKAINGQIDVLMQKLKAAVDSDCYYSTVMDVVKNAMLCDYYDCKSRSNPKYRSMNAKRIIPVRAKIVEGGMYYYNHNNNARAMEAFELYIETADNAMFANENEDLDFVTYYASLLAYGTKEYKKAEHYADLALTQLNFAKDAAEIKINCMKKLMVTKNDSDKYVIALLELHDKAPENKGYFLMLMDYFTSPGHEKEVEQFANDEISKDSTNALAWILKGETEMKMRHWDNAICFYKKAVAQDSSLVQAIYNIGICYRSKAIAMKDSLAGNRGRLSKLDMQNVKAVLAHSMMYLESAKDMDPDMKKVDWATPLYQIYSALSEKDKAEDMKLQLSKKEKK